MSKNLQLSRDTWKSRFGFLMAAVGFAIGLGNLWRFPYLVGTYGGGAFVLLYLIVLCAIGMPLMLTELTLGQYGHSDAYGCYKKIHPKFGIFGKISIFCAFLILCYYGTVGGWVSYYAARYLGAIFGKASITEGNASTIFAEMISSPAIAITWHLFFIFIVVFIVLQGLEKGTERAGKIMMPGLFLALIVLAIISCSLAGAANGIIFYLKPDLSKLSLTVLAEVIGQVFFSIGVGMAVMMTYGSYLQSDQSLKRNSVMIPLLDTSAAVLAGFVIFPAVFAMGKEPSSGPGLIFITLPQIFNKIPAGNWLAFAFFVAIFFAAITSAISMLEVAVAYYVDQKKFNRRNCTVILGSIAAIAGIFPALSNGNGTLANMSIASLLGNPTFLEKIKILQLAPFDLLDYLTGRILLPIGGLALCISAGWVMGKEKLLKIITKEGKSPFKLANLYFFSLKYISPLAILVVLIQSILN
ncbi:MAG: sodium-dependent transporter [Spirochaetia bacterium]